MKKSIIEKIPRSDPKKIWVCCSRCRHSFPTTQITQKITCAGCGTKILKTEAIALYEKAKKGED